MMTRFSFARALLACLAIGATAACSDSTAPEAPSATATLTVDASATPAYVALGTTSQLVTVADSSTSSTWDLRFYTTSVVLNGGTVGPGNIKGYCICANESKTNEQVLAMTATGEAAAFDSITVNHIPHDSLFSATVFATKPWYRYNLDGTHQISPMFNVYLIKHGTTVYKVQLTSYYNTAGAPRYISFRYSRIKS